MEPPKELTLIWLTALGPVDFRVALAATVQACAKRQWPPAVADIVAELEGSIDASTAWDMVGPLVASLGLSEALARLEHTEPRAHRALRRCRHVVREQSADAARRAFLRAWVIVADDDTPVPTDAPELVEFVDPVDPETALADAKAKVAAARGPGGVPMTSGVTRSAQPSKHDDGLLRPDFGAAIPQRPSDPS